MTKYAALLASITIDADNKSIRRSEAGVAATVTMAEGVYFLRGDGSASDICKAIKDALENGVGTNVYSVTITRSVDGAASSGVVTITRTSGPDTFALLFADALTTFDPTLIGFTVANTADDAAAKVSTKSPAAQWVANDVLRESEPDEEHEVAVNRAWSGRVKTTRLGGPYDVRSIAWRNLDSRRVLRTENENDVDATFAAFLELVGDGKRFELHNTTLSAGTTLGALSTSTRIGSAWLFDEESAQKVDARRRDPGLPLYAIEKKLLEYVA